MKLIITSVTFWMIFSSVSFSQGLNSSEGLTGEDYLKKSKNQKIAGFLLLGSGATTIAILSRGHTSFDALPALAVAGAAATIASFPLFIASRKNKRKAMDTSVSLVYKKFYLTNQQGVKSLVYPGISFNINI